jgi:hypothetical protein
MRTFVAKIGLVELSITSIDSLIAVIPHLLGFVPTKSVVCLWTLDKRISLTMRVDLPVMETNFDANAWAEQLLSCGIHSGGTNIHVVIYADVNSSDFAQAIGRAASHSGLHVDTLITMCDAKRFEYECTECHSSKCIGHEVMPEASDLRKMGALLPVPAASREEVIAEIDEILNPHVRALVVTESAAYTALRASNADAHNLEKWRDESIALVRRDWGHVSSLDDPLRALTPQLARSIVALNDVRCRDAVLWVIARPDTDLQQIGEYLAHVVINAPESMVPGPASVLSAVRWLQGDGLRAMAACLKALNAAPDYTLALLVETALRAGLPPVFWLETMRVLTYDQCRARRRVRPGRSEDSDTSMSA